MKNVTKSKYVGVIAVYNYGLIDGCSVSNSILSSTPQGKPGIICSFTQGSIINSFTYNNQIEVQSSSTAGGIVGNLSGNILNCYTYKNTYSDKGTKFFFGTIAGTSLKEACIENCYIYHSQKNTTRWGTAVGNLQKIQINYFYYNKGNLYGSSDDTSTKAKKYDESSFKVNETHISTLLDNWVTDPNRTSYKDYTFKRWKIADDGSACFQ